jgi:hypothetical protein
VAVTVEVAPAVVVQALAQPRRVAQPLVPQLLVARPLVVVAVAEDAEAVVAEPELELAAMSSSRSVAEALRQHLRKAPTTG